VSPDVLELVQLLLIRVIDGLSRIILDRLRRTPGLVSDRKDGWLGGLQHGHQGSTDFGRR
jgi:hypothetical protein